MLQVNLTVAQKECKKDRNEITGGGVLTLVDECVAVRAVCVEDVMYVCCCATLSILQSVEWLQPRS